MNKILAISIMTLIFLSNLVFAEERAMRVGFEEFPPSAFMKDGKPSGIDVEILEAAMSVSGVKINFYTYPWARCLLMLDKKQLDAVIPMVYSEERAERYSLGTSMRTRENVIILKKEITGEINKLEELSGMTIASGKGYAINKEFDEAVYIKKDYVATAGEVYEILVKKVASGRVDGAVVDLQVLHQILKKLKAENRVKITKIIYKKETHVGFIKNSSYFPLYEKGIKVIKDNGELKKIIDKWNSSN